MLCIFNILVLCVIMCIVFLGLESCFIFSCLFCFVFLYCSCVVYCIHETGGSYPAVVRQDFWIYEMNNYVFMYVCNFKLNVNKGIVNELYAGHQISQLTHASKTG